MANEAGEHQGAGGNDHGTTIASQIAQAMVLDGGALPQPPRPGPRPWPDQDDDYDETLEA